jgi:ElaB/YqjD/DUF883 family membrane-anchored ribosome-binding protein
VDARVVSPELRVLDYPTAPRSTETIETLIYSVERLLGQFAAGADSEMSRLRVQANNALAAAKAAVARDEARLSGKIAPLPAAYLPARIRELPGTALAVAAILGIAVGVCTGRAARSRPRRS